MMWWPIRAEQTVRRVMMSHTSTQVADLSWGAFMLKADFLKSGCLEHLAPLPRQQENLVSELEGLET